MNARLTIALHCWLLIASILGPAARAQVDLTIDGLEGELLENARASLTQLYTGKEAVTDAATIRAHYASAPAHLRRALQPFGYYRPQIESTLQPPANGEGHWQARFMVQPGERLPLAKLQIDIDGTGSDDEELLALAKGLALQRDSNLDHRRYEQAKRDLLAGARELGYLDASLARHRIEIDLDRYQAQVFLLLESGPRYVYGDINWLQQQFSRRYLQRYLILQPGARFRQSEVARQRSLLSASGHFSEVKIEQGQALAGASPQIPLTIQLQPLAPNLYRGRVGWGTDTGFGLGLDWTRRYLGRRGQHFNLGAAVAEERERLAVDSSYFIPLNPLDGESLEINARHESKDLDYQEVDLEVGGDTRIATNLASLFWHLPHSSWGDFELKATAGISLVGEDYDIFEVLFGNLSDAGKDAIREVIGEDAYQILAPEFEAVVPALRLQLRRSDDALEIRRGDYYELELLGTDEALGSNISFWQAHFSSWNIWPLADRGRFLLRTELGYSDADSSRVLGVNFNDMPEYFEFRAGGARSVRGYGFEELFPADAITGGKHLLVASAEYEHEVIPDWSVAGFLDAGNAYNDIDDFDEKLGAGIGVRWRSPVGLARIDLAFPLDDADDSFQIYITVGPEF